MTPDFFRWVFEFISWLIIIRYVHFMIVYVQVIWPLRKEIGDGAVLAPPARTTLFYHCTVLYMVLVQASATLWALSKSFPFNIFIVALIPGSIALFVVVHIFASDYSERLHEYVASHEDDKPLG